MLLMSRKKLKKVNNTMNSRINNVIRIPTSLQGKFFRFWIEFLQPFHHLTGRECDVLTEILKERYTLSKKINDIDILNKVLMSDETKKKIREACDMSLPHFQVIMGKLKKVGIISDNKVNPRFIPNVREGENSFQLLLLFDLKK